MDFSEIERLLQFDLEREEKKSKCCRYVEKLSRLLEKGENKDAIEAYEALFSDSIDKYGRDDDFYELDPKEILKIIKKSEIKDVDLFCEIINRMDENMGSESVLLLNTLDSLFLDESCDISCAKDSMLEKEFIKFSKVISQFSSVKFLNELSCLLYELEKRRKNQVFFQKSDICWAASEGKL